MNRIKALIKYQLRDYSHVFLIMYLCVYLLAVLTAISNSFMDAKNGSRVHFGSVSGMELITAVTIFVVGLNSFKEDFKFFSANGVSRKTQFFSTAAALGILSAAFAFVDTVNCVIFKHAVHYFPWFLQMYGPRFGYSKSIFESSSRLVLTPQILFENFLWLLFTYFFVSMIGFFITILYYRMNKGLKIAVSIVVPTVLINGVQPLDYYFFNGKITAFIQSFTNAAWGFANGYNPFIAMFSMFLFAAFFAALAFLLARRATVKK